MTKVFVGAKVQVTANPYNGAIGVVAKHDGSSCANKPWLVRLFDGLDPDWSYYHPDQLKVLGDFGEFSADHYLVDWCRDAGYSSSGSGDIYQKYTEQYGKHHIDLVRR